MSMDIFFFFIISYFYHGPIYRFYTVPVFRSTQHPICYKFLYILLWMGNDEMMMIEYFNALFLSRYEIHNISETKYLT